MAHLRDRGQRFDDNQQVSQLKNRNRSQKGLIGLQNQSSSRVRFTRLRIKELP
jgi:hypothetical protein